MKEWNLDDFEKPKGKETLKTLESPQPKKIKSANKDGSIRIYMTKEQELQLRTEAMRNGMSASTWLLFQLNNAAQPAPQ